MPGEPLLEDLARETILDHYRRPRRRGELPGASVHVEGVNPVCGDEITLDLAFEGDRLKDLRFGGQGCSISQASASMMAERVAGADLEEVRRVHQAFRGMLVDGAPPPSDLGDLESLAGVANYPVRVKCALLCWNVLQQGLEEMRQQGGPQ